MTQQMAWNAGDIDQFMEGYWKSEKLVFTSGSRIRKGWQATRDGYKKSYSVETMGHLSFSDLEFEPLGTSGMMVLGRWKLEGLSAPAGGVFSLGVRRMKDGWRVIHDHTSSDEPKD